MVPDMANECWSAVFMSDALYNGQRFRTFIVVDDYNRECLAIEIGINLTAVRIIRTLNRIVAWRGYPRRLRLDNGPEMLSVAMQQFCMNRQKGDSVVHWAIIYRQRRYFEAVCGAHKPLLRRLCGEGVDKRKHLGVIHPRVRYR